MWMWYIGDNSHKGEEYYGNVNWGVNNSSLASTKQGHMVGSNNKYDKVEIEWKLKSI